MRIEEEIEELNRQATLLEERAYLIRRQQRAAEGNTDPEESNYTADPEETNRENDVNNLARIMSRSGITPVRH